MAKTIWKYSLEITDKQFIKMPKGSEILTISIQNDVLCIWAMVDPSNQDEDRCFEIFGTGHIIYDQRKTKREFIGTFRANRDLIFHCFERIDK